MARAKTSKAPTPAKARASKTTRPRTTAAAATKAATGRELPPDPAPDATRDDDVTTEADRQRRRYQVLQLRYHRKLTNLDVAQRLGVTERTIERDFAWWREQWHRVYGTENPVFDPVEKIGETIAFYEQIEERALEELVALDRGESLTPAIEALRAVAGHKTVPDEQRTRALQLVEVALTEQTRSRRSTYLRMRCLKVAQEARLQQVNFLQDLGLLDRNLGTLDLGSVQNPRAFARLIEKYRHVPEDALTSAAERAQRKGAVH
jgi:hypothetical protein